MDYVLPIHTSSAQRIADWECNFAWADRQIHPMFHFCCNCVLLLEKFMSYNLIKSWSDSFFWEVLSDILRNWYLLFKQQNARWNFFEHLLVGKLFVWMNRGLKWLQSQAGNSCMIWAIYTTLGSGDLWWRWAPCVLKLVWIFKNTVQMKHILFLIPNF